MIVVYYGPAKRSRRKLPTPHPAPPDQPANLAASARAQRHQHRRIARPAPDRIRLERLSPPPFRDSWQGVRLLSRFPFRVNERFLYEYDFGDLWQHQIRFEGIQPIREKKIYPVCVGGACASPPEDCGGPEAYMRKMDHHRWYPPLDELQLIADAVGRVLDAQVKVTKGFETFSGTLMLSKKQLIDWSRPSGSGLVALIDESSIADSSSMPKAMKNGSGNRWRRHEDQDPNHD